MNRKLLRLVAAGVPIRITDSVPIGSVYTADLTGTGRRIELIACERLTAWRLTHPGREPMLSVNCRGISELERDRRRR